MTKFVPRKPVVKPTTHPVARPQVTTVSDTNDHFLGGRTRAVSSVLYGTEGIGKTSLIAQFPECGFICDSRERRIEKLADLGQVPAPKFIKVAHTWDNVLELLADVAAGNLECKNLAIDATTGLQQLCFASHCAKHFNNDWSVNGFMSYGKGPANAAQKDWPNLFEEIQQCLDSGVSVHIIGHAQVSTFQNPEGANYNFYGPALHDKLWEPLVRFVDMVLFYNTYKDVSVPKNEARRDDPRGKGSTDLPQRMLYTQRTDLWVAKNCYNLSPVIACGLSSEEAFEAFKRDYLK